MNFRDGAGLCGLPVNQAGDKTVIVLSVTGENQNNDALAAALTNAIIVLEADGTPKQLNIGQFSSDEATSNGVKLTFEDGHGKETVISLKLNGETSHGDPVLIINRLIGICDSTNTPVELSLHRYDML